jgi:hypothetical protein
LISDNNHAATSTTSTLNLNTSNNISTIDLYMPTVDLAGHVVGHNIETVTLPYSF